MGKPLQSKVTDGTLERGPTSHLRLTLYHHRETAMAVRIPRPASELPKSPVSRWRIFETADESRLFVGVDRLESSGRVNSPILTFDPVTVEGASHTGRICELSGPKGSSLNVQYVWARRRQLHNVTSYIDVAECLLDGAADDDPMRAHKGRDRYASQWATVCVGSKGRACSCKTTSGPESADFGLDGRPPIDLKIFRGLPIWL